jgi:tetratricopeptide (TPR) repeat protein
VQFYSDSINLDEKNALLLANRGQLYIMLSDFPKAIMDTNAAINLDHTLAIAYYRKALAQSKGDWSDLVKACETI